MFRLGRALLVFVSSFLSWLVLPVLVNVATGGTAPALLRPYEDWTVPAILVGFAVAVTLAVWQDRRAGVVGTADDEHGTPHPRNRTNAISRVEKYLDGRLGQSVAHRVRVTLGLDFRPEAVIRGADIMVPAVDRPDRDGVTVDAIEEVFRDADESLLLMGAPGAGKSTTLLSLAKALLSRAREETSAPIPVVVELTGWASDNGLAPDREDSATGEHVVERSEAQRNRLTPTMKKIEMAIRAGLGEQFESWLESELRRLYRIPQRVARAWLNERGLVLLLDGLDEVHPELRYLCVEAINEFVRKREMPPVAVCCRTNDYANIKEKLTFQEAVTIAPLARGEVRRCLEDAGDQLAGVRSALDQDPELWELIDSPLFLNVLVLAFHDRPASEIRLTGPQSKRRKHLFEAYIEEVMRRRRTPILGYRNQKQSLLWMETLALSALAPRNSFPLRRYRLLATWSFTWSRCVPPARSKIYATCVLPLFAGTACTVGGVVPMESRYGASAATLLVLLFTCVLFALLGFIKHESTHTSSPREPGTTARAWTSSVILGLLVGAADHVLLSLLDDALEIPFSVLIAVLGLSLLVITVLFFVSLETAIPPGAIEPFGWLLLITSAVALFLVTRWQEHAEILQYGTMLGAILGATVGCVYFMCYLAVGNSDENPSWQPKLPDVSVFLATAALSASAIAAALLLSADGTGFHPIVLVGCGCGLILGGFFAWVLVHLFCDGLVPFNVVLGLGGLLPFRLNRFLRYCVDRGIVIDDVTGYRFLHGMLGTYFCTKSEAGRKYSQLMNEWDY